MQHHFETEVQNLARAGIATHVVVNTPDVDAVFTIAKAQDMPEVRFAAAFDGGMLALGCPDGLPEVLLELATPIDVADVTDELAGKPNNTAVNHKIELLARRIVETMPTPGAVASTDPDLASQLAQLKEVLHASAPQDGVLQDILQRLDDITAKQDQASKNEDIQSAPADTSNQDKVGAQLSQIQTQMAALSDQVAAVLDHTGTEAAQMALTRVEASLSERLAATDIGVSNQFDRLAEQIATHQPPTVDMTVQRQSFAQFATALNAMIGRLETATAENIAALKAGSGPQIDAIDIKPLVDSLQADLADIKLTHHNELVALRAEIGALPGATVAPDLSSQHPGLAMFATALSTVMARLETSIDHMIDASIAMSDMAQIPDTDDQNDDMLRGLHDGLVALREGQQDAVATLRTDIATLHASAAPVLDLTAQRQGFARFGTALSGALDRFQMTAQRIEDQLVQATPALADKPVAATGAEDLCEIEAASVPPSQTPTENRLDAHEDAHPVATHTPASLNDLRLHFAEMIALQIRQTAQVTTQNMDPNDA